MDRWYITRAHDRKSGHKANVHCVGSLNKSKNEKKKTVSYEMAEKLLDPSESILKSLVLDAQ